MKNLLKKYWLYILAFLIPWAVVVLHSWFADTWVTGGGHLLRGDMNLQLVPFYYELWNKVHTGGSFAYTWNIGGGMDFHPISGYLISPFTLLVLILPQSWIPDVVQFIMVTKLALVCVSMVYYFYHTKYNTLTIHKKVISLFLGLAFALGNGMLNFMGYIQFNDIMICLPILLLLVERMVETKRWKLYYLLLTFCMISNLYLAYLICIFLLLWFGLQITEKIEERGKKILIFAGSSVLAALTAFNGICIGILFSASRYSIQTSDMVKDYCDSILVKPQDFIGRLFIFSSIGAASDERPNIYFSLMALVLTVFFLVVRMEKRKKLYLAVLTVFMTLSYFFGGLSFVWHLFSVPNGELHRFSNFFIFLMLFLALLVITRLDDIKPLHVVGIGLVQIIVGVVAFFHLEKFDNVMVYLTTTLLVALYIILLFFYSRKRILNKNMLLMIVCFGIAELCVNAYFALDSYDVYDIYGEKDMDTIAEKIDKDDGERVALSQFITNTGLLISQNSDSGFISGINGADFRLHQALGMPTNGSVEYAICGGSPVINLLFNIRYGIGLSEAEFSDAEKVWENEAQLYRIKRIAGLGYMTDSDILNWDINTGTIFDVQSQFISCATGQGSVFCPVEVDMTGQDAVGMSVEMDDSVTVEPGAYLFPYECRYGSEMDTMVAIFTVTEEEDLYLCSMITGNIRRISVFVDGEQLFNSRYPYKQQTVHVGKVKKGQTVMVCAVPVYPETMLPGEEEYWAIRLASFDEEAYEKAYEILSKNVYDIQIEEDDYISGTIRAEQDGVMMTSIPAQDGFEVYVDGNREEYVTVGGAMIGVPLEQGEHTVEFKYRSPSSLIGKIVSIGAVMLFIILCLMDRRKPQTEDMLTQNEEE